MYLCLRVIAGCIKSVKRRSVGVTDVLKSQARCGRSLVHLSDIQRTSGPVYVPKYGNVLTSLHMPVAIISFTLEFEYYFSKSFSKALKSIYVQELLDKDTVPTREKDFVAHHFSHNAPHRPYVHCTHRGEGWDERGAKEKRESKTKG